MKKNLREALGNTKAWAKERLGNIGEGVDMSKYATYSTIFGTVYVVLGYISVAKRGYKEHLRLSFKHFPKMILLAIFTEAACIVLSKDRTTKEEVTDTPAPSAEDVLYDTIKKAVKTAPVVDLDSLDD